MSSLQFVIKIIIVLSIVTLISGCKSDTKEPEKPELKIAKTTTETTVFKSISKNDKIWNEINTLHHIPRLW